MRLTYPQMGEVQILLETVLQELGVETAPPPPISRETVTLGVKYAPETACFPFKVNLGNYLQAIRAGADTILMAGGCGPCRFGIYAEVQREILRELGHDVDFVILEPPRSEGPRFWNELHRLLGWRRMALLPQALKLAWCKLQFLDDLGETYRLLLPREIQPGSAAKLYRRYRRETAALGEVRQIERMAGRLREEIRSFPKDEGRPLLRLRIGGEIYMVLEPAVNYHTEETLGSLGVEVHREVSISHWVRENLLGFLHRRELRRTALTARKYLRCFVGGHALFTVADAVRAGVNRWDGLIQIMPFTCMPELVAQSILPEISRALDLPVLTLVLDEHSGEAGVRTRLEAFVDLARRRRRLEALL